jgi:hypothetical protein
MENEAENTTKKCRMCERTLHMMDFGINPRTADGLMYVCKSCTLIEGRYRTISARQGKKLKEVYEEHRQQMKRYRRLMEGMTPRQAALDEIESEKLYEDSRTTK